jgi:hypothetical protein
LVRRWGPRCLIENEPDHPADYQGGQNDHEDTPEIYSAVGGFEANDTGNNQQNRAREDQENTHGRENTETPKC